MRPRFPPGLLPGVGGAVRRQPGDERGDVPGLRRAGAGAAGVESVLERFLELGVAMLPRLTRLRSSRRTPTSSRKVENVKKKKSKEKKLSPTHSVGLENDSSFFSGSFTAPQNARERRQPAPAGRGRPQAPRPDQGHRREGEWWVCEKGRRERASEKHSFCFLFCETSNRLFCLLFMRSPLSLQPSPLSHSRAR